MSKGDHAQRSTIERKARNASASDVASRERGHGGQTIEPSAIEPPTRGTTSAGPSNTDHPHPLPNIHHENIKVDPSAPTQSVGLLLGAG